LNAILDAVSEKKFHMRSARRNFEVRLWNYWEGNLESPHITIGALPEHILEISISE